VQSLEEQVCYASNNFKGDIVGVHVQYSEKHVCYTSNNFIK
jgi:hypothetical protein